MGFDLIPNPRLAHLFVDEILGGSAYYSGKRRFELSYGAQRFKDLQLRVLEQDFFTRSGGSCGAARLGHFSGLVRFNLELTGIIQKKPEKSSTLAMKRNT